MEQNMVDKGFELRYYKLSYRRRFIRTLWLIPWAFIVLKGLHWISGDTIPIIIMGIIFGIGIAVQAMYNYRKWKEQS